MKFKTLCTCLALVMYAETVSAMDSSSSHSNDSKNANVETAREMTWKEFLRESPKGDVIIIDKEITSFDIYDLHYINEGLFFPNLTTLYFSSGMSQLSDKELKGLSSILSRSPKLIRLSFKRSRLEKIPDEVFKLNLQSLSIIDSKLGTIPKEIGDFANLKSLDLHFNDLKSLPKEIGALKNLTGLRLSWNKLTNIPKEMGNLTNVTWLDLSYNGIISLPVEIGNLNKLTELNVTGNELTILPKEIGNLENLENLYLRGNGFTVFPKEIGNLTKLKGLYFNDNTLVSLSKEIGNLKNLIELDLSFNRLTELPKEIGNLKNLIRLNLLHNELTELPKGIDNLTNLLELSLDKSVVTGIYNSCDTMINLSNRNLIRVPFDIVTCSKLKELDLSNNDLENIPSIMVQLQDLKRINLRGNVKIDSIDKINDAIFGLPKLELLILTENGRDKSYNKNEIAKEREKRMDKIKDKLLKYQYPINDDTVVKYLNFYKNKTTLGRKELQKHVTQDRKKLVHLPAKAYYLEALLDKLKKAAGIAAQ